MPLRLVAQFHGVHGGCPEVKAWGQQSAWKDWERTVAAEIWLQIPPFLDAPKNWELDWAAIGAVIFVFISKTRFLGRVSGILGDALRFSGVRTLEVLLDRGDYYTHSSIYRRLMDCASRSPPPWIHH
jgi:hypothetical protein